MSIKDHLYTPEEATRQHNAGTDIGRGSELSFGFRTWMPAVTIQGNDYSLAYENITEDHIKGIPVKRDDRVIGYIESLKDGLATLKLNEGETLELSPEPSVSISVGRIGFIGETLEGAMLESLDRTVGRALRPIETFVKEMAQGGNYEGVKQ